MADDQLALLRAGRQRAGRRVAVDWGSTLGTASAILSANRPEWHIADLAILGAGLVSTPVYPTSSSSQIAHILGDCRGPRLLRRGRPATGEGPPPPPRPPVPGTRRPVRRDGRGRRRLRARRWTSCGPRAAARLAEDPSAFDALSNAVTAADLATLVYTSGTTGPPKGTMISHGNIMATLRSLTSIVELRPTDRFLSFLPLSHITERSVSHFGQVAGGGETWFARSLGTVPEDLQGVPADAVLRRSPRMGEVPRRDRRGRRRRTRRAPGDHAPLPRPRRERGATAAADGARRTTACCTRPSTAPSVRCCDAGSASTRAGCWPRARRPCTRTCCAGSTASACPSTRATARPRSRCARASTRSTTSASGRWAVPSPEWRCASPMTARSSCAGPASVRATGIGPTRPRS